MKLNDTIMTYDVAEALQDESGTFEVISPNGERYFVTRQTGRFNFQPGMGWERAQYSTVPGAKSSSADH